MPASTVLSPAGAAALRAASCAGPLPTRLLMTCTEPGSDASRSSENSGNGWNVEPDGGRMPGPVGIGGAFGGPGGTGGAFGGPVGIGGAFGGPGGTGGAFGGPGGIRGAFGGPGGNRGAFRGAAGRVPTAPPPSP